MATVGTDKTGRRYQPPPDPAALWKDTGLERFVNARRDQLAHLIKGMGIEWGGNQ